jgi:hypothetical protein
MSQQSEIIIFFREVQRIITKHGLKQVLSHLRLINTEYESFESNILKFIISITSNHYKVDKDDLLNSNKRGLFAESRRMCFALIKEHLPFSDEQIGNFFGGRSRQYINREILELPVNKDYFKNKKEQVFVNDFILLSKKVIEYKNSYLLIQSENKEQE